MKEIVLLDLFSGTGGFAKGFEEAGFKFKYHYFSEIDKYAIANYQYNFKNSKYVGRVEEVRKGKIEKPDVITFGFPCQDISVVGKRIGLKGKRSSLFFEAIRIIKEFKPGVFIFENVKGLFSSNKGKDFEVILKTIAELGVYDCEWQLLNTRRFLPQNRERVFFIGHLRGKSVPKVFPVFNENQKNFKKSISQIIGQLSTGKGTGRNTIPHIRKWLPMKRVATERAKTRLKKNRNAGKNIHSTWEKKFVLREDHLLGTITTDSSVDNLLTDSRTIRKLTPLECERLQGFPDNWTRYGRCDKKRIEISDHQRYKLTGNAVSVPVVRAIAKKLISGWDWQK